MKAIFKNILWLLLLTVTIWSCSKKDVNYKSLIKGGEIYYPGVISNQNYRGGDLRAMLVWNPSPDPNITKYKIYWNNKQDSIIVDAATHVTKDTVKVIIPNLSEGTYFFNVYSIDNQGHISIPLNINSVRVFGAKYQSGIFNRGYNADTPYITNLATGKVQLKFNKVDTGTINTKTVIKYFDNTTGAQNTVILRPDSTTITLNNFKFGTDVTYQSSYLPMRGAIDTFTVATPSTYPQVKRIGDLTAFYIKNPGNPFYRSDSNPGKWGLLKDWQYNANVLNQDGGIHGGFSTDNGGCVHFEARDYSGDGVNNGKVYQTFTLPAGTYSIDVTTAGYGGNINANEVISVGNTVPDIDQINSGNTIAWFHGDQNSIGGTHTLNFTLTQTTTVTYGWVVSTTSYTYLQFTRVALRSL